MKNITEKENIPFVNMMPSLREYLDDKVFLENDLVHLTPFGHQLVARELFKQVNAAMESDRAENAPSSHPAGQSIA